MADINLKYVKVCLSELRLNSCRSYQGIKGNKFDVIPSSVTELELVFGLTVVC